MQNVPFAASLLGNFLFLLRFKNRIPQINLTDKKTSVIEAIFQFGPL